MRKIFNKIGEFFNDFRSFTKSGCIKRAVVGTIGAAMGLFGLIFNAKQVVEETRGLKAIRGLNKIDD